MIVVKRKSRTVFRFLGIAWCVFLILITLAFLGAWVYLTYGIDSSIDQLTLFARSAGTPSKLYAISASGLPEEYGEGELSIGKSNDYVSIDQIPKDLVNAFIAIEDKRFYSHIGFDFITTTKAVFKYAFSTGNSPGGSTITQQLIKNLTGNDEVTIKRKLTEIMQAIKLEKVMEKDEILELYLNSIYLSQGTYGVCAAAKLYFNKPLDELTLLEAAAIAAITQAPTKWDPIVNPENNKVRRNTILKEMLDNQMIGKEDFDSAYDQELTLSPSYDKVVVNTSSWYTDAVISEAITLLENTLGVSRRVAEHHLYRGGYKITVAVNPELQAYLEEVYENKMLFPASGVQSSFVILDPKNGNVLAAVGGIGEKNASRILNRATQTLRSPGSAIKPLSLFLPAVDRGILSYSTPFDDVPLYFGGEYPKSGWPKNASGRYAGLVEPERAIAASLNTAAVSLLNSLGIQNTFSLLQNKLGFHHLTNEDMSISSLALGGMHKGVSLLELTAAYTPLANAGIYTNARFVLSIEDAGGNVVVENRAASETLFSEQSVQIVTQLLKGVIKRSDGTAYGAVQKLLQHSEAAGKTGTTSYNYDRWFIGYTPLCLGGIWLGYDEPSPLTDIGGKEHIKLWDTVMSQAHSILSKETSSTKFSTDGLIEAKYCICSGKIPTEACYLDPRNHAVKTGYFTRSDLPKGNCGVHFTVDYCREGGGVAGNGCPKDNTYRVSLIEVKRSFPYPVSIRDYEYTGIKLEDGYTPFIDKTMPYYKYYVPQDIITGKSDSSAPFHRFCQVHPPNDDTVDIPPDS